MSRSEEFRAVKSEASEILGAELPEQCKECPINGTHAGSLAVAAAFRYDGLPREDVGKSAHNLAKVVNADCSYGPSTKGGDFPHSHCNLGVRH